MPGVGRQGEQGLCRPGVRWLRALAGGCLAIGLMTLVTAQAQTPSPATPEERECAALGDRALALDLRAAQTASTDLASRAKLVDEAMGLWADAVQRCSGRARERAERNLAVNRRQRGELIEALGGSERCLASQRDGLALQDLAEKAFAERRFNDAASLFQKAESSWDLASERCTGGAQQQARQRRDALEREAQKAARSAPAVARPGAVAAVVTPAPAAPAASLDAAASAALAALPEREIDIQHADGSRLSGRFRLDPVSKTYSGLGKLQWRNGNHYEGTLVQGVPHGEGRLVYLSGDVYKGRLHQGLPDGQGEYLWVNGQRYEGPWERGVAKGRGVMMFANGNQYEGEVLNGQPQGRGRMRYHSGGRYEGNFQGGQPQGPGVFVWPDGQRYEGPWQDGKAQGQGRMRFASGNVYAGPLVDGEAQGSGRMDYANGDVYEGDFERGVPHGRGRLVGKNGVSYVGDWKAGRRDGRGTLTWANGDRFEGVFAGNEATADGRIIRKSP